MESLVARSLLQSNNNNGSLLYWCPNQDTAENDAGFQYWYQAMSNWSAPSAVCTTEAHCGWLQSRGSELEGRVAMAFQYIALATCILALVWYAYNLWKATTGWEEVYVVAVELVKVSLELQYQYLSPATLYLNTGNYVLWIRYGEWLLTCPVILIHLSNITGLADSYNKRTMMLLVSDLGCIVMGVTSAACYAWPKWIFFFLGLAYGCNTYFHAAKVYIESYHIVPKGICRHLVRGMAWCFYTAWTMFPLLFVFGPTGFGINSRYGDEIGHQIADIISKQLWGFLGHMLRLKIHEHIIIHGNITKPTKVKVAGVEIDAEEMVEHDDPEGVDKGTQQLANRESFIMMRNRMRNEGIDTRGSFDEHAGGISGKEAAAAAAAVTKANAAQALDNPAMATMMGALQPGRVILAVPDVSMVDFFRQQFAALPAPIELVPALGLENTVALVQQALQLGGLDCVLAHPEFLRDKSPAGLVGRLHSGGQRVVAFGWSPMGPMRELIETSGADAWLEGPSFGTGINQQQLVATLVRAQQARRQQQQLLQQQQMMGGALGGMGMMMGGVPQQQSFAAPGMMVAGGAAVQMAQFGGLSGGLSGGGAAPVGGLQLAPGQAQSATLVGTSNPLFSQAPQASPGSVTPTRPAAAGSGATAAGTTGGGAASEAEMLQQLMAEINRLKGELGER